MAKAKKQALQAKGMGELAFFAGLLLAIVAGFFTLPADTVATVLVILGLVVGLVNVVSKESISFLVASIALLVAGSAGLDKIPLLGIWLEPILTNIVTFVAPAAIIVAIKAVYGLARKK